VVQHDVRSGDREADSRVDEGVIAVPIPASTEGVLYPVSSSMKVQLLTVDDLTR